ncbi:hypothetical protein BC828DRAFT_115237 [Blastocladiella britannica]|nr:hypothetical protein BC828DRAFT_115237 [Blastocladiella britannica]
MPALNGSSSGPDRDPSAQALIAARIRRESAFQNHAPFRTSRSSRLRTGSRLAPPASFRARARSSAKGTALAQLRAQITVVMRRGHMITSRTVFWDNRNATRGATAFSPACIRQSEFHDILTGTTSTEQETMLRTWHLVNGGNFADMRVFLHCHNHLYKKLRSLDDADFAV